jgi:hypothetical protein
VGLPSWTVSARDLFHYSISMLPKYLKKIVEGLALQPQLAKELEAGLDRIEHKKGSNVIKFTVGACRWLLRRAEQLIADGGS